MLPDAKLCFTNLIQVRAGTAAAQILNMLKFSRESTAKQKLGSKKTLLQQYTLYEQQSNTLSKHKRSLTKQTNSNTL